MSDEKFTTEVTKLLISQGRLINIMALALADTTMLLEALLSRCEGKQCDKAATVHGHRWDNEHRSTIHSKKLCDECAARQVHEDVQCGTSEENAMAKWRDLPNAKEIRHTTEYVYALRDIAREPVGDDH